MFEAIGPEIWWHHLIRASGLRFHVKWFSHVAHYIRSQFLEERKEHIPQGQAHLPYDIPIPPGVSDTCHDLQVQRSHWLRLAFDFT